MASPDQAETAARLRAAMAYGGLSRDQAADVLNVSKPTLDRMTGRKGAESRQVPWNDLWRIAEAAGLPPEFFSADFDRLDEIVPEGMPVVVRRSRTEALQDTEAALRELGRRRRERHEEQPDTAPDRRDPPGRSQGGGGTGQ